jgi:hypothetical protein
MQAADGVAVPPLKVWKTNPQGSYTPGMDAKCVADVEGPWRDPDPPFESSLIDRCRQYWTTPIAELPDEALATFLGQRIALALMIPEARDRVVGGRFDGTEWYDGHLAESLANADPPA